MTPFSKASPPNITFDRTAGSHSLAAAGQRERWAARLKLARHLAVGVRLRA